MLTLSDLLARTREHRIIDYVTSHCKPSQVFLSTKAPYQAVGRSSISRWLVTLIGRAGIDITTYTGHSTRSASTSKAASLGVPIEVIVQQANWKCASTFEKFYHKPIDVGVSSFSKKSLVLENNILDHFNKQRIGIDSMRQIGHASQNPIFC